jgi:hypothetical protein
VRQGAHFRCHDDAGHEPDGEGVPGPGCNPRSPSVALASSGRASARSCSAARPKWSSPATATKYRTLRRSRSKLPFAACDAAIREHPDRLSVVSTEDNVVLNVFL